MLIYGRERIVEVNVWINDDDVINVICNKRLTMYSSGSSCIIIAETSKFEDIVEDISKYDTISMNE